MAVSDEEIAHALDLFADLGLLSTRKMFGGLGIYHAGSIFAVLMSDGRLLLKGQGEMQGRFDKMGLTRWTYQREGKAPASMPYWELPDSALDDADEAVALARAAIAHL
ncbi:TfoX/Sxy family protein [uncultured Tateyamaria sp.]|uniref:TfoX/Sxy family protein n=1 Tax=uncultured Tateyamaria sp. TaxID=455651 RepID=UPI00260C2FB2|nr:TfoX/Sxy family protein [uncultured Tateyamaria sp.]